jgi:hexokinase
MIETYSLSELQEIRASLVREFRDSEEGKKTSLVFARHVIQRPRGAPQREFHVFVIGGSNMESAVVEASDEGVKISKDVREKLPVLESKNMLFELLCRNLGDAGVIGLNFAYPLRPLYRDWKLDGSLLRATKEHSLDNLIGKPVGQELEQFIYTHMGKRVDVVTANDTVCLILAGLQMSPATSLAGGVIGTGFNFGFFIDDATVVNLESGNFDKFRQTDTGKEIDRSSDNPGSQLLEKEVSGAYLFNHFNIAENRGANSERPLHSTRELSDLASRDDEGSESARMILKRSASLVAVELAAIYDFKESTPLNFIIEGSLFWDGYRYREWVNEILAEMGIPSGHIQVIRIDKSSIIGAARLIY